MSLIDSVQKSKAKRIHVFENGLKDAFGHTVLISPIKQRTWNKILCYITQSIRPSYGVVRHLKTINGKQSIHSFTDLVQGARYVACGKELFRRLPQGYHTESEHKILSKKKCSQHYEKLDMQQGNNSDRYWDLLQAQKNKRTVIYVFVNGQQSGATKFVLMENDLHNWPGLLSHISNMMDIPEGVRYLYTIFGHQICGPCELQHGAYYVAVPCTVKFQKINYAECHRNFLLKNKKAELREPFTVDAVGGPTHVETRNDDCFLNKTVKPKVRCRSKPKQQESKSEETEATRNEEHHTIKDLLLQSQKERKKKYKTCKNKEGNEASRSQAKNRKISTQTESTFEVGEDGGLVSSTFIITTSQVTQTDSSESTSSQSATAEDVGNPNTTTITWHELQPGSKPSSAQNVRTFKANSNFEFSPDKPAPETRNSTSKDEADVPVKAVGSSRSVSIKDTEENDDGSSSLSDYYRDGKIRSSHSMSLRTVSTDTVTSISKMQVDQLLQRLDSYRDTDLDTALIPLREQLLSSHSIRRGSRLQSVHVIMNDTDSASSDFEKASEYINTFENSGEVSPVSNATAPSCFSNCIFLTPGHRNNGTGDSAKKNFRSRCMSSFLRLFKVSKRSHM